jgi:hypothetical protein
MRLHIDAWDPSYGVSYDSGVPDAATNAPVDPDVERPASAWQPLLPAADVRAPGSVLLVDGVRRIDARIWVDPEDGTADAHQGICASYAAGVVRCDLAAGVAQLVGSSVAHAVFAPGPTLSPIAAHPRAVYRPYRVAGPELAEPELQRRLHELEVEVSEAARQASDELLVVDGPLRGRTSLPETLGYAKTHHKQYLPPELARVVPALRPGQRTPLFSLGAPWNRYSWYLRLPGPEAAPWAGVVRLECAADQQLPAAIEYADVSAVTLPRFASTPYKDPRAPQNLVPIAGLERRLRALLGDQRLLQRGLRLAATRAA